MLIYTPEYTTKYVPYMASNVARRWRCGIYRLRLDTNVSHPHLGGHAADVKAVAAHGMLLHQGTRLAQPFGHDHAQQPRRTRANHHLQCNATAPRGGRERKGSKRDKPTHTAASQSRIQATEQVSGLHLNMLRRSGSQHDNDDRHGAASYSSSVKRFRTEFPSTYISCHRAYAFLSCYTYHLWKRLPARVVYVVDASAVDESFFCSAG